MRFARKVPIIFLLVLAAEFGLQPVAARADSDGYFCSRKGYVAMEFRSFSTQGLSAEHVLKVVRFGAEHGIRWAGEIALPDFQPHQMRCLSEHVKIAGWNKGHVKFTIDVSQPGKLKMLQAGANPQGGGSDGPAPPNLGLWCGHGVVTLDSEDSQHIYQIVCTDSQKPVKGGIEHHHKSEIVQKDKGGKVTEKLLVFEGTMLETVD